MKIEALKMKFEIKMPESIDSLKGMRNFSKGMRNLSKGMRNFSKELEKQNKLLNPDKIQVEEFFNKFEKELNNEL